MVSAQFDEALESLTSQAISSWTRFKQSGLREDLDTTVSLDQAKLDLCPDGHPERVSSLHNLALDLRER